MTQQEPTPLTPLGPEDSFVFSCHPGVSCFNECCRDLNQFLTPYDILRLKNHFGLSSSEFLEQYTSGHMGPQTGLPVVTLRFNPGSEFACPFVSEKGCTVYENRPASCRSYPLVRLASRDRETGQTAERYFILAEPHCRGFETGQPWTAEQWIHNQGLENYNVNNDLFMELIAAKAAWGPGPLDLKSQQVFRLACYDLDRFRERVEQRTLKMSVDVDEEIWSQVLTDEALLLRFALQWVGNTLFQAPWKLDFPK